MSWYHNNFYILNSRYVIMMSVTRVELGGTKYLHQAAKIFFFTKELQTTKLMLIDI